MMAIAAVGNNLITYVFSEMHFPLSKSANVVTNFVGTVFFLSLLGGFLSDSYLGSFRTMLIFGFIELSVCTYLFFSLFLISFFFLPWLCLGLSYGFCYFVPLFLVHFNYFSFMGLILIPLNGYTPYQEENLYCLVSRLCTYLLTIQLSIVLLQFTVCPW